MRFSTLLPLVVCLALPVAAQTAQTLPYTQNWSDVGMIVTDDDWSGVPGIIGYQGNDITTTIGADAQTVLADGASTTVDVNANEVSPATLTSGGVSEFELADPTIALNGSGTADAPHIVIRVSTSGVSSIRVRYRVRDLDDSADDAIQQVALQFRAGTTGDYTNVPAAYIADATTAASATQETLVDVTLPVEADNQAVLDLRILTVNALGSDEWVGIDDIQVTTLSVAGEASPEASLALSVANPVVGTATVRYAAPTPDATLALYSVTGRQVATLAAHAGTATLDTRGLAAGVYVLRLDAGGQALTRLVTVVR